MGLLCDNIVVWSTNGIEYLYPEDLAPYLVLAGSSQSTGT